MLRRQPVHRGDHANDKDSSTLTLTYEALERVGGRCVAGHDECLDSSTSEVSSDPLSVALDSLRGPSSVWNTRGVPQIEQVFVGHEGSNSTDHGESPHAPSRTRR